MLHKANSSPLWFKEDGSSCDPMLQDRTFVCIYVSIRLTPAQVPPPHKSTLPLTPFFVTPRSTTSSPILFHFFFPTCPFVGPPFVRHQTISFYILFTFRYGELARTLGTPQPTAGPKRNDSTTVRRRQGVIF